MKYLFLLMLTGLSLQTYSQSTLHSVIEAKALEAEDDLIKLRRHFHQFPELSNREFKTADRIAKELEKLGLKVDRGIAHTGVIGVLETGKPGPTIGLRADIDALPVTERAPLPFASKEKSTYLNQEVGVMHACGHDTHIAMLLSAAKVLTSIKDDLEGKIVFIFQPAEEGAPPGEEGGAKLMVKEGVIAKYGLDVIFGQHITSNEDVGTFTYRFGGLMAAADVFTIKVKGKQTHGSRPWQGVDPIVTSAQIILGLQTIVSRQINLTNEAAVITVGKISGGVRSNIIPEEVELIGTIRTLDTEMQKDIHERIRKTATQIAESQGAVAEVDIQIGYPVTYNNPDLTREMLPSLFKTVGEEHVRVVPARTGAEDFSFFANEIPAFYFFTGGREKGLDPELSFPHHTPDFSIDESGLIHGVKAFCFLAVDYLEISASRN